MKGPGVFGTYIERLYEPDVTLALMQSVQLGWICVDVGAHLGYFILLMAYLVGDTGRVFAFEALPENVRWLKENVALNGFTDRVTIENQAITDGKQSVVHLHAPLQYTSEWSIVRPSPIARSIAVRATSLEQYFAQGPRVDFIKIDIEGAEFMALQGSQTILRHHRPLCLVELHGEEGQRAVRFLLEMGYGVEGLKGQAFFGPPFPCHILARPGER
ncbi:MAG: FkbM family methyltransferase [Anaerolineae bacterium]|nr:FkbM family methyltransferase [Anaerolineae bacterium]